MKTHIDTLKSAHTRFLAQKHVARFNIQPRIPDILLANQRCDISVLRRWVWIKFRRRLVLKVPLKGEYAARQTTFAFNVSELKVSCGGYRRPDIVDPWNKNFSNMVFSEIAHHCQAATEEEDGEHAVPRAKNILMATLVSRIRKTVYGCHALHDSAFADSLNLICANQFVYDLGLSIAGVEKGNILTYPDI